MCLQLADAKFKSAGCLQCTVHCTVQFTRTVHVLNNIFVKWLFYSSQMNRIRSGSLLRCTIELKIHFVNDRITKLQWINRKLL